MKNIEAARDCIRELVEISADKKLLPFQEVDLMKHAGMTAINLSTFFDEYNSELIRIINNSSVPNIVSVTAAVKFSEIVFEDPEKHAKDLQKAIKNLNVRWLLNALDIVHYEIDESGHKAIDTLVQQIDSNR